jgi:repressor of nif and glnA expression
MIDYAPFRNVEHKSVKISIDSIRSQAYKSTLKAFINKQGYKLKEIKSYSKISINAKKLLWSKEVTSLHQLHISHFKNIYVATPHKLNQKSEYRKCNIVAFGLSQITRPLHVETKQQLADIFNKFGVTSLDLSVDSEIPIDTSLLEDFGTVTKAFTTCYINKPNIPHISKICYYDKSFKDSLSRPLYRLELTIRASGKLKDLFIPYDEIKKVLEHLGF